MSERTLTVISPEVVEAWWPSIRELLIPAIEFCNGEFEVDDLLDMVMSGRAFVVVLVGEESLELAAVCECLKYPRKSIMNVLALGGKNFEAVNREFWPKVVDVAKVLGASAVRGAVRPVMERLCKRVAPDIVQAYAILERRL
jgi:hypothetical protein